ncbi:MAG: DUF885 family protein [Parvularculaceae bacterium]|nr:DUF885 family protein [Parvularculaceae bacterium]
MRLLSFLAIAFLAASASGVQAAGPPAGKASYEDLVALFAEFDAARLPEPWNANFLEHDAPRQAMAVYQPQSVKARLKALKSVNARLDDMNVAAWPIARQSEYLAVRAQVDGEEFRLKALRPWARDPGFYADMLQRIAFTELPVQGDAKIDLEKELSAVPEIIAAATVTLDDVARDYALLAIHNLTKADGVGHGHPRRETPPAGVIGWYDDLLARAVGRQPDLVDDVRTARDAVLGYKDYLEENLPQYTAKAGVGARRYDWYLRQVKLLPYDGDEMILAAQREWERTTAGYALAQHRDRNIPELKPADSAAEYQKRIETTDKNIRDFLVREEIITIPPYVGDLDTNAPFIVRPDGPNFWEAVQFRDPHPDHLHAVIPGHRFDGLVEDNNKHPIRGKISDGVRAEGWGVYLEESMMLAGVLSDKRRVDELIYLFGVFRAARVPADVGMQRNEMTVADAVKYMMDKTPWLDANVARVDAEIYLRRPPGYGVGYTIGALQMRGLLADARIQKGVAFNLKDFHDDLMARGRLPISLLRWEMTGLDDEVERFWARSPIPAE